MYNFLDRFNMITSKLKEIMNKTKEFKGIIIPKHVNIQERVSDWLNDKGFRSKYNKPYTKAIVTCVMYGKYEDMKVELAFATIMKTVKKEERTIRKEIDALLRA